MFWLYFYGFSARLSVFATGPVFEFYVWQCALDGELVHPGGSRPVLRADPRRAAVSPLLEGRTPIFVAAPCSACV
jgi:hypothetical protein